MNTVSLADWRRRVAELYTDIRRADDPEAAWALWREHARCIVLRA